MHQSSLLDIWDVDETQIGLGQEDCYTGYLDNLLTLFERHEHPVILVGGSAEIWSGARSECGCQNLSLLIQSAKLNSIVEDLERSGDWTKSTDPSWLNRRVPGFDKYMTKVPIPGIWLEARKGLLPKKLGFTHIQLLSEDIYKLSIHNCKIEVPDVFNRKSVLLEEEYYRESHGLLGFATLSQMEKTSAKWRAQHTPKAFKALLDPPFRCKWTRRDIPIFIPSIEMHLNALLDQVQEEMHTGKQTGFWPSDHINVFINDHEWDSKPASLWLLENKVEKRNLHLMEGLLARFRPEPSRAVWKEIFKRTRSI